MRQFVIRRIRDQNLLADAAEDSALRLMTRACLRLALQAAVNDRYRHRH